MMTNADTTNDTAFTPNTHVGVVRHREQRPAERRTDRDPARAGSR